MKLVEDGTITTPSGFRAAGVSCGLKSSGGLDLAIVHSQADCSAAGVFTRNKVAAAPVIVDKDTLAGSSDRIRAVVINAAVANARTWPRGLAAATASQTLTAK